MNRRLRFTFCKVLFSAALTPLPHEPFRVSANPIKPVSGAYLARQTGSRLRSIPFNFGNQSPPPPENLLSKFGSARSLIATQRY